jgi:hypothetical protein
VQFYAYTLRQVIADGPNETITIILQLIPLKKSIPYQRKVVGYGEKRVFI